MKDSPERSGGTFKCLSDLLPASDERHTEAGRLEREIASTAAYLTKLRRQRRQLEIDEGKNARAESPRIKAIKAAYVANEIPVEQVARAFGTSPGFVQRLARDLNWPRRSTPKCTGQKRRRADVQTSAPKEAV